MEYVNTLHSRNLTWNGTSRIRKGNTFEPNLHDFGFKMLVFARVIQRLDLQGIGNDLI